MYKIKCNDEVVMITGRNKGKRGKVARIVDAKRIIISGVNIVKKHAKANPKKSLPGGIVDKEAPVQISNVAILNNITDKPDRVGFKIQNGKKYRVFKSNNELIDISK